jgi:hypothetical protein
MSNKHYSSLLLDVYASKNTKTTLEYFFSNNNKYSFAHPSCCMSNFKLILFLFLFLFIFYLFKGDLFSGLNDGLLSRAEALAAVDMQKHQSSHAAHQQMTQQLKVVSNLVI